MPKKVSYGRAALDGGKDSLAVVLLSTGASLILKGEYLAGGALCVAGWICLVYDKVIQ